jgi:hypothetical protein
LGSLLIGVGGLYQPSLRQTHEKDSRIGETVIRHGGQKEVRDGVGGWTSW